MAESCFIYFLASPTLCIRSQWSTLMYSFQKATETEHHPLAMLGRVLAELLILWARLPEPLAHLCLVSPLGTLARRARPARSPTANAAP